MRSRPVAIALRCLRSVDTYANWCVRRRRCAIGSETDGLASGPTALHAAGESLSESWRLCITTALVLPQF